MKILSFGSLNIDKVYTVSHFIRPGETMAAVTLEEFCGGKGLNQSIALAKAGAEVWHAGCVGEQDGGMLIEALRAAHVDVSLVQRLPCPTGHAMIQVNEEGQNCILLYDGANQCITRAQINQTLDCFDPGDFLILQNEINELDYLITSASRRGLKIVLNPSPMTEALRKLPLELVDYFVLNEIEAKDICGTELPEEEYPNQLQKMYPQAKIVLTLGEKGSIYQDGALRLAQQAVRVEAVDTTAAGDTFTGYLIAGIAAGATAKQALRTATCAAAIAVGRKGAAPSIPIKQEVAAFEQETFQ